MALEPQSIQVSFSQGADNKSDPKQLSSGKMVQLTNASLDSPKQFLKRDGYEGLPKSIYGGSTSLQAGLSVTGYQNELVSLDGQALYSYSPELGAHIEKGALISTALSVKPVVRNTNTQNIQDEAYDQTSGLKIFTWTEFTDTANGIKYSIFDALTNAAIVSQGVVATGAARFAKVLNFQSHFIIVYYDASSGIGQIFFKTIPISAPTTISGATAITSGGIDNHNTLDCQVVNANVVVAIATGTLNNISVYNINSSFVVSSPLVESAGLAGSGATCLSVLGDSSNNAWIGFGNGSGVGCFIVNSSLGVVLAPTTIDTFAMGTGDLGAITGYIAGASAQFYYSIASPPPAMNQNTITLTGTIGTASAFQLGVTLASKVFLQNSIPYFFVYYGTFLDLKSIEPTYFLLNGLSGQVTLKLCPAQAGTPALNIDQISGALLPEMNFNSETGDWFFPYLIEDNLESAVSGLFFKSGVQEATLSFPLSAPSKLQIAESINYCFGQVWQYDGQNIVEQGFHLFPENITQTTMTGGGIGAGLFTSTTLNQVQYIAIYEWVDNQGNLHQSATSPALTVPLNSPPAMPTPVTWTANSTLGSPTLTSVSSFTGVFVGQVYLDTTSGHTSNLLPFTYITAMSVGGGTITLSQPAQQTNSGDTYGTEDVLKITVTVPTLKQTAKNNVSIALYRTQNNQTIFYRVSPLSTLVYNDPTVQTVNIIDTTPDSQISANQQLYTTGGVLDNDGPPALSAICTFKSRAVGILSEQDLQFQYSQQVIPGTPLEWSSFFQTNVDSQILKLSAIAPLDDKLIFFGPKRKFYMVGDGPGLNGSNNDFSASVPIAGVNGCVNQNSIVEVPVGLIYQNPSGQIWLLDRSLAESYIGADVETSTQNNLVTAAMVIPGTTKVLMTLNSGNNVVFDYFVNQWEVDIYPTTPVDLTTFENVATYIDGSGLISQQTPGVYSDNGAVIPLSLKTGWMNFAGIEGFQRVWQCQIFGTYFSPHTLTVNIYTDYETSPGQSVQIPVLSEPSMYQFSISIKNQKCESIQIEIIESQTGSGAQGLSLSGLAFWVGIKKGLRSQPAVRSY